MDHQTVQRIARLKIYLRAERGILLNTQRFVDDRFYAQQMLDSAEESDNLEFVTLALDLRNDLGWLTPAKLEPVLPSTPKSVAPSTKQVRYLFGARSL